jgi:hypothetical protein
MFLWRNAGLEKQPSLAGRWDAGDEGVIAVMRRAEERGVLAPGVPDWWRLISYISLLIAASGEVRTGRLAPLDGPDFVLRMFLTGIGARPEPGDGAHE